MDIKNLTPMAFEYFSTGKHRLEGVAAQIIYLKDYGYLDIVSTSTDATSGTEEFDSAKLVLKKIPEDEPDFVKVLFNGIFYHTEEIELNNLPLITSYAILESIRYLEFDLYHEYHDKAYAKSIYEYSKTIEKDSDADFGYIYALGKGKSHAKLNGIDIGVYDAMFQALEKILTPTMTLIGRKSAGGIGRGLAAAGPIFSNEDATSIKNIQWDYLLTRK